MPIITVRLSQNLLHELDALAHDIRVTPAEYIRLAIANMNNEIKNKKRAERLKKISLRTRKESMHVNKEFDEIENDN